MTKLDTLKVGDRVIVTSATSLVRGKCGIVAAVDERSRCAKIALGRFEMTMPFAALALDGSRNDS
jgi:hypothetical protein